MLCALFLTPSLAPYWLWASWVNSPNNFLVAKISRGQDIISLVLFRSFLTNILEFSPQPHMDPIWSYLKKNCLMFLSTTSLSSIKPIRFDGERDGWCGPTIYVINNCVEWSGIIVVLIQTKKKLSQIGCTNKVVRSWIMITHPDNVSFRHPEVMIYGRFEGMKWAHMKWDE